MFFRVSYLNLSHIGAGKQAVHSALTYFDNTGALTGFRMAYNEIGDGVGSRLVKSIARKNNLVVLDLAFAEIGKKGTTIIFESLAQNTTLTELNVSGNETTNKGIEALAGALKDNGSLQVLGLRHCGISKVCCFGSLGRKKFTCWLAWVYRTRRGVVFQ